LCGGTSIKPPSAARDDDRHGDGAIAMKLCCYLVFGKNVWQQKPKIVAERRKNKMCGCGMN